MRRRSSAADGLAKGQLLAIPYQVFEPGRVEPKRRYFEAILLQVVPASGELVDILVPGTDHFVDTTRDTITLRMAVEGMRRVRTTLRSI